MAIRHSDLAGLDATGCAALVRAGELTPLDLVDAAIDRAEQVNGTLNAIVTEMYDHAREVARAHSGTGIFAGVPFLVKDFLAEVEGVRFTEASAFLSDHVPAEDSELVRRFRAAGLVFIGKTNTPELAIGPTTEPRLFGPTRKPVEYRAYARRIERRSGGGGLGPGGADGPRQRRRRLDPHPRVVLRSGGTEAEPGTGLARSALRRHDHRPGQRTRGDAQRARHRRATRRGGRPRDRRAVLSRAARALVYERGRTIAGERSRIGFSVESPLGDAIDPECERAVRDAAALCESLGHVVEEARPDCNAEELWTKFTTQLSGGAAWAIADWERRTGRRAGPQHFEPFVWAFAERGRALGAHDYLLAVQDMQRAVRDLCAYFGRYDLWLTSTLGQPPVELGTLVYRGGDPFELRRRCRPVLALYLAQQRERSAGDLPAAALVDFGASRRRAFRRPLGRGGDAHSSRGAARTCPPVGRSSARDLRGMSGLGAWHAPRPAGVRAP